MQLKGIILSLLVYGFAFCSAVFGALGFSSLFSLEARANSSITVQSKSQQNIFEIVYKSSSNDTPLDPGVYAIDAGTGDLELAFKGDVLGVSRGFNGVHAVLGSGYDGLSAIVVVIDGRIVILNQNSRKKNKSSFIELGSSNTRVRDILTGQVAQLNPVRTVSSIRVVESTEGIGGDTSNSSQNKFDHSLLISIEEAGRFGTGLTLFVPVQLNGDKKNHPKVYGDSPLLIGNDFLDIKRLKSLIKEDIRAEKASSKNSLRIVSPILVQQLDTLLSQEGNVAHPLVKKWKQKIESFYHFIKTGVGSYDAESLSVYNPFLRRNELENYPAEIILKSEALTLLQAFDPYAKSWIVSFEDLTKEDGKSFEPSLWRGDLNRLKVADNVKVVFDESKKEYKIFHSSRLGESLAPSFIIMSEINGQEAQIALFPPPRDGSKYLLAELSKSGGPHDIVGSMKDMNFLSKSFEHDGHIYYFIVASYRVPKKSALKGGVTYLYSYELVGGILTSNQKPFLLSNEYISESELPLRLVNHRYDNRDIFAFDGSSPIRGANVYKKKEAITLPFYNITSIVSTKGNPRVFLHPKRALDIIPGKLTFREYEYVGYGLETQTGFYIEPNMSGSSFYQGMLLDNSKHRSSSQKAFLDEKRLKFTVERYRYYPEILVGIIPYLEDVSPKAKDSSKVSLGVYVQAYNISKEIRPAIFPVELKFSPEQIVGAKIVQGKRDRENEIYLLIFLKKDKKIQGQEAGLYSVHLRLGQMSQPKLVMETLEQGWIDRNPVTSPMLKQRIKLDSRGDLYWIHDPSIDSESVAFAIRPLSRPTRLIYPNRQGEEKVRLRFSESVEDLEKTVDLSGKWLVAGQRDIKVNHWGNLESDLEKFKKASEGLTGKELLTSGLFNQFEEFFENFADPKRRSDVLKRQVILVDSRFKKDFFLAMVNQLIEGSGKFSVERRGSHFDFYAFDGKSTSEEIIGEMKRIRDSDSQRGTLLFVDAKDLTDSLVVEKTSDTLSEDVLDSEEEETSKRREISVKKNDLFGESVSDEEIFDESSEEESRVRSRISGEDDFIPSEELESLMKIINNPDNEKRINRLTLLASDGKYRTVAELKKAKTSSPEIPMVILATPGEWTTLKALFPEENALGVFNRFELNYQFYTSSWTLWPPTSAYSDADMRKSAKMPISSEEQKIFPNLEEILMDAALGRSRGRQRILIVPQSLKPLIEKMIENRWANYSTEVAGDWNFKNPGLSLFKINNASGSNSQSEVMDNFNTMRALAKIKNVVLLGDLKDIQTIGRPRPKEKGYYLRNNIMKGSHLDSFSKDQDESKETPKDSHLITPHMMWLLATEGQRVKPYMQKSWSLEKSLEGKISTILVGTEEEFRDIESEIDFESRYVDFQKHFEMIRLQEPTDQVKFNLLQALFDRVEIRSLGLEFQLGDLQQDEARRQLISHLVNRTDQIVDQIGGEPTEAFIRVFTELRRTLVEDIELRRSRKITKNYMERFFAKVFPMPLNPDILENSDPLKRLTRTEETVRSWRDMGYEGSSDLKRRVIQNVLNQTRPTDSGRPVPSSMILYGDTSTGKTFLAETLMSLLNIKQYDFLKASNEDAEGLILRVSNIVSDKSEASGHKITVEQAIEGIEDLLTQPKGHRAWIVIDDIHKAPNDEVYSKLMTFIQSLFDTQNGLVLAKKKGSSEIREVPVRNLNLFMTINPERDKAVLARYVKNESDLNNQILAALTRGGKYKMEDSFLARWSDMINLDKFPRSAKVPALVARIRESSKLSNFVVLVEPSAINKFVEAYPNAHAREFLSPAASALTSIPPLARPSNLYIVTPKEGSVSAPSNPGFMDSLSIERKARELTNITAVNSDDLSSQLKLISFVLHNFRSGLFNNIVLEAQNSNELNLDVGGLGSLVRRNFILSFASHAFKKPEVPISELVLRPDDLSYLTQVQYEELYELQQNSKPKESFFPMDFAVRELSHNFDVGSFITGQIKLNKKSQLDVLSDSVKRVEQTLLTAFREYMRLSAPEDLYNISSWNEADRREWFERLSSEEPKEAYKRIVNDLIMGYRQFEMEILDPDLERNLPLRDNLSYYEIGRIYAYVIDKAITRLPWGLMTKFVMDVVSMSGDLSLGQKPSFINYLYKSEISPFAITTTDLLEDMKSEVVSSGRPQQRLDEKDLDLRLDNKGIGAKSCASLFK